MRHRYLNTNIRIYCARLNGSQDPNIHGNFSRSIAGPGCGYRVALFMTTKKNFEQIDT